MVFYDGRTWGGKPDTSSNYAGMVNDEEGSTVFKTGSDVAGYAFKFCQNGKMWVHAGSSIEFVDNPMKYIHNKSDQAAVMGRLSTTVDGHMIIEGKNSIQVCDLSGNYASILASAFTQASSRKFKDNINPISDDIVELIKSIQVVSFSYKNTPDRIDYGFIAEDVDEILPSIVYHNQETGDPEAIDYTKIIPHLTRLIQIQQDKIDYLEKEVSELKEFISK